jgi:tRNA pseudouridine55 synthase
MDTVLNIYKRYGETPLQALERYVAVHPEYKGVKMTYAGRLDPMAEGVLVLLTGEKNKEREAYTGLPKEYEFEFILGVETDTYDLLGKITSTKECVVPSPEMVSDVMKKYVGTFEQSYPAYSSKVVAGKQLFEYARSGTLGKIVLPRHSVTVTDIKLDSVRTVSREEFLQLTQSAIKSVQGDFRQKEILALWEKYGATAPKEITVYKAHVSCGSGFYVRQLISDIGRELGTGAVTSRILRTRVGDFKIENSIR